MVKKINDIVFELNPILKNDIELSDLLINRVLKRVRLFNGEDDFFHFSLEYRGSEKFKTYSVNSLLSLNHEKLMEKNWRELPKIEKGLNENNLIVLNQIKEKLKRYNINLTVKNNEIDFGNNRNFQSSGDMYIYNTNEYSFPDKSNLNEAIKLLKFEINNSIISLATIYDMVNLVNRDYETNLTEKVYQYFNKIEQINSQIINRYINNKINKINLDKSKKAFNLVLEADELSLGKIKTNKVN